MEIVSYTALRQNLSSIMHKIEQDSSVYKISRKNHPNLIIMTEDDLNSLNETLHILSSQKNAAKLFESIKQAEDGDFVEVDLED